MIPEEKNSESITGKQVSLFSILTNKLKEAAELDKLISLSKVGSLYKTNNEEISSLIQHFYESTIEKITILDSDEQRMKQIIFTEPYSKWLELAILSACRNMIKHTFSNDKRKEPRARCYLTNRNTWSCLAIENEFIVKYETNNKVKDSGTLSAIKGYVRSYDVNSRMVELKRLSLNKMFNTEYYKEVWVIIIPLPDNTNYIVHEH